MKPYIVFLHVCSHCSGILHFGCCVSFMVPSFRARLFGSHDRLPLVRLGAILWRFAAVRLVASLCGGEKTEKPVSSTLAASAAASSCLLALGRPLLRGAGSAAQMAPPPPSILTPACNLCNRTFPWKVDLASLRSLFRSAPVVDPGASAAQRCFRSSESRPSRQRRW